MRRNMHMTLNGPAVISRESSDHVGLCFKAKSVENDDDESQLRDADSPAVRVPTAAETVEHLQQASLWFETTQTDKYTFSLLNFTDVTTTLPQC